MWTRGFSLVELSIVLVILGLLTGGILSGQSLIRAAELRSVGTQATQFMAAVHSFRDKYMALPGDFKDATKFWGKDNAACSAHTGTAATPGTCNGSGDGFIGYGGAANGTTESFQAWKQLALAGLIEGNFTGLAGATGDTDHNFGSNSPAARISNAGWGLGYINNLTGAQTVPYAYDYRNAFTLGNDDNSFADGAVLRPEEAWNIDTKIDDGRSAYGKLNSTVPACTGRTTATDFTSEYQLGSTTISCGLTLRFM